VHDWSVDHATLSHYRGRSPLVDALLEYSSVNKLHGTYVLPYLGGAPARADGETAKPVVSRLGRDKRIYAQFKQHGAESGRFSSANPNLQNIPSRSAEGKKLREVFVADPGHLLVVADYSQIEPRIIASLSGDATMIRTYRDGGDVYEAVADRMGVTRSIGKELVLSIAYGVGPQTISVRIGCTPQEARDLMGFFNDKFPAIAVHKNRVLQRTRRHRYAETVLGRRRPLPAIAWADEAKRAAAERQAYNHVIQGTAADVMKIALVNIHAALPDGAAMLMTVHDEVMVQCPEGQQDVAIDVVRREMEAARPSAIVVPLVADVNTGRNWAEGKG
jgi:DNA polymerase-1